MEGLTHLGRLVLGAGCCRDVFLEYVGRRRCAGRDARRLPQNRFATHEPERGVVRLMLVCYALPRRCHDHAIGAYCWRLPRQTLGNISWWALDGCRWLITSSCLPCWPPSFLAAISFCFRCHRCGLLLGLSMTGVLFAAGRRSRAEIPCRMRSKRPCSRSPACRLSCLRGANRRGRSCDRAGRSFRSTGSPRPITAWVRGVQHVSPRRRCRALGASGLGR